MPNDRRHLLGAFREVAHRIHVAHPDHQSPNYLDGLTVVKRRLTVVKFLPTGTDGTGRNHGLRAHIQPGRGMQLQSWHPDKGRLEMSWTSDPSTGDWVDALIYVARWAGLLFGGSQELMDWSKQRKQEPRRDLVELAKERTS